MIYNKTGGMQRKHDVTINKFKNVTILKKTEIVEYNFEDMTYDAYNSDISKCDVCEYMRKHRYIKRLLKQSPTELDKTEQLYRIVLSGLFHNFIQSHQLDRFQLPSIRACYVNEHFLDVAGRNGVHDTDLTGLSNGRFTCLIQLYGVNVSINVEIEPLVKLLFIFENKVDVYVLTDIFDAYSYLLLQRILEIKPKYHYIKKEWYFNPCDGYEKNYSKMIGRMTECVLVASKAFVKRNSENVLGISKRDITNEITRKYI